MEIDTGIKNIKKLNYNLHIFDEERIVKTINNILLCKSYCYEEYGPEYDYDFHYKNIFVTIRYRYNCPIWRSDNCQEMIIQFDTTKINKEDLDFLIESFDFLLEKVEKFEIYMAPENLYKIDEIIKGMDVKKLIKGEFCIMNPDTLNFYKYQYRFEYKNIEVAIRISGEEDDYDSEEYEDWDDFVQNNIDHKKQLIIFTYADNEEKIDKNDIEFIKNKFRFL